MTAAPTVSTTCLFCRIIAHEVPAFVVIEEPDFVAFLDHRPLFFGHTLVAPRRHIETLLDLPAADVGPYFASVQRITAAVTEAMDASGTFVAMNNVVSQSVPHLHVHVVPRRPKDGLRGFFWPRTKYDSDDDAKAAAAAVRGALA